MYVKIEGVSITLTQEQLEQRGIYTMTKQQRLYGESENFEDLREINAVQVYMRHVCKLQSRKLELEARGISTYTEQQTWEELDAGIRFWKGMQDMVYKNA